MDICTLHDLQLDMMKMFRDKCQEEALTYYMVGGTLLGAAKYQGFIPWDDDVDFAMPRKDFDYLAKYADKIFPSEYKFETYKNKGHFLPYGKLIARTQPIVKVGYEEWESEQEIFLIFDVYPIDGLGNSVQEAKQQIKRTQFPWKILMLNLDEGYQGSNPIKKVVKTLIQALPVQTLLRWLDRKMSAADYEKSEFVTRWRPPYEEHIYEKEVFEPAVNLLFCGERFKAPHKYDFLLRSVYGDYEQDEEQGARTQPRHSIAQSRVIKRYRKHLNKLRVSGIN